MHVFIMVLLLNLSPLVLQVGEEFKDATSCTKSIEFVVSQDAALSGKLRCFEIVLDGVV